MRWHVTTQRKWDPCVDAASSINVFVCEDLANLGKGNNDVNKTKMKKKQIFNLKCTNLFHRHSATIGQFVRLQMCWRATT